MSNLFQFERNRGKSKPEWLVLAAALAWLGGLAVGGKLILEHAYSAGQRLDVPRQWPENDTIRPKGGKPLLVMGVHPGCPCSLAGIEQLDRLFSKLPEAAEAYALFYTSPEMDEDLEQSPAWKHAKRIQGLTSIRDRDGTLSEMLSIGTSGETLLFDSGGALQFHGGLTPSRGHAGASYGFLAVRDHLSGRKPDTDFAPVFGCALYSGEGK